MRDIKKVIAELKLASNLMESNALITDPTNPIFLDEIHQIQKAKKELDSAISKICQGQNHNNNIIEFK